MMASLADHAQSQPDKTAVIDDRGRGCVRVLSFRELDGRVTRLANALINLGVHGSQARVIWCGQNSAEIVEIIHAARRVGATAIPLNYRFTDDEAAYVIDHSDATVIYTDIEIVPMIERIRARLNKVQHVVVFGGAAPAGTLAAKSVTSAASDATVPPPAVPGANLIYTSGTTGRPKGALRPVSGAEEQTQRIIELIGLGSGDVYLPTGPLYHSGPLGFLNIAMSLGQTVVLQRKFDAADWLRMVSAYRVTSTFAAPTPIRQVCSLPAGVLAGHDTSSMRYMIANAAPWSMALKRMYLERFPADSLFELYGSTELGLTCLLLPHDQLRKPGSCGRPLPMVDVKLLNDKGREQVGAGPEHAGELYVKSPALLTSYYKQTDKFLEDRRDDYQTVGDIAYRDDEGYIYICDRKKDMIISGGMNVYPAEVEAALESHPAIYEAAVFGIPSEQWGETVHAVLVAQGSVPVEDELRAYLRTRIAGYKLPRSMTWRAELPKTGSGKVLKRELRAPYWAASPTSI
jgi:acyl-CoA synthetase (AMP-forming)/AMP-acid ligase II